MTPIVLAIGLVNSMMHRDVNDVFLFVDATVGTIHHLSPDSTPQYSVVVDQIRTPLIVLSAQMMWECGTLKRKIYLFDKLIINV